MHIRRFYLQRDNAPSQKKYIYRKTSSITYHTCTTQSRIGYLTIPKSSPSKQYGSLLKITSYNLPVSSINLCTTSKTIFLIEIVRSGDPYSNKSMSVIAFYFHYLFGKGGYVSVALVCLFVCLSVCLLVCEQHYSKSYKRIRMKFYGGVRGSTMKNWLNFGGDLGILRWVKWAKTHHNSGGIPRSWWR